MSIYEYDEELHIKSEREFWYNTGVEEGENRLAKLLQSLVDAGRNEDVNRAISEPTYRERLYHEYGLDVSK